MALLMGAFVGGSLAFLVMPFLAFAGVMFATVVVGSTLVCFRYGASFQIVRSALVLLFFGQVGFGIALVTRGLIGTVIRRRPNGRGRPDDGRANSTPLSYLEVGGGHRLFMTQALEVGSYKKFRLGMWDDGRPASLSRPSPPIVALVELRISDPFLAPLLPPVRPKTNYTTPQEAAQELRHLGASYSPVRLAGPSLTDLARRADTHMPVSTRGVVEHRGKLFISVPLADFTLHSAVVALGPQKSAQEAGRVRSLALHTMVEVARSLAPMHAARVLHRDLKLENVLVGPDGHLTVSDLGLAAPLPEHMDAVAGFAGTLGHLAPEVLAGRGAGLPAEAWGVALAAVQVALHRTHVFAADTHIYGAEANGMRAYRRFHHSLPRAADGTIALADARGASSFPHWAEIFSSLAHVSEPFATFVLNHGLHPDPSCRATLADLERFAAGELAGLGLDADVPDAGLARLVEGTPRYRNEATQLRTFRLAVRLAEQSSAPPSSGHSSGSAEDIDVL